MNAPHPHVSSDLARELTSLAAEFEGELRFDGVTRQLYSTDASVYQEMPLAVAFPRSDRDIQRLIEFANEHKVGLIPRTAGTSLAGQVVGSGIVVDVSKHLNQVLEINRDQGYARVQPGVIRNELNQKLAEIGMMFAPETSTANRAMIGGMIGNNSCGSNSIVYGSTREHVIEVTGFLSDGTQATFGPLDEQAFLLKAAGATADANASAGSDSTSLESRIYQATYQLLADAGVQAEIRREFPKPEIHRRNTGYAVDRLLDAAPLALPKGSSSQPFNFCQLIAGSEGTLFFVTEAKLNCVPLPPPISGLLCVHFEEIDAALRGTQLAMRYRPFGCELIDRLVLEGAARNLQQRKNTEFVVGDPGAILVVEFRGVSDEDVARQASELQSELNQAGLGYAYPLLLDDRVSQVWELRKSGLGVVSNIPGDTKPVAVIEDTAVALDDLPEFIRELTELLQTQYGIFCVHYAHAGAGELHLRPPINLKTADGNRQFRQIAAQVATLVKKYRGSLSGEHGDGRLRAEFLQQMVGAKNYQLLRTIKQVWDPENLFNPNKIIDAPPMNQQLRYRPGQAALPIKTVFDFSEEQGVLRAAELCNGSGDCRKTERSGGTMCPSYMATRDEADTTRARANMLRHVLTDPTNPDNPFDHESLKQILDLCLSCKGCKNECPSNVDMAKLKAEFLQAWYDTHGVPRRAKLVAGFADSMAMAAWVPWLYNAIITFGPSANLLKKIAGFSLKRSLPKLHSQTLRQWFAKHQRQNRVHPNAGKMGSVVLFCDEFTLYNDVPIGIAAIELLERLGYRVEMPQHRESGRSALSKGLLRRARMVAEDNVTRLSNFVSDDKPLLGIEPSALLSFRDEYPVLVSPPYRESAKKLAANSFLIDEFLATQIERGRLDYRAFNEDKKTIRLHGHCHQKALSSVGPTVRMLQLPKNYSVKLIPSGCCGMAGSFGYESEHYELSLQIGELVLFPTLRKEPSESLIAANGTSCRHQIADGTGRVALHPIEILRAALKPEL